MISTAQGIATIQMGMRETSTMSKTESKCIIRVCAVSLMKGTYLKSDHKGKELNRDILQ